MADLLLGLVFVLLVAVPALVAISHRASSRDRDS